MLAVPKEKVTETKDQSAMADDWETFQPLVSYQATEFDPRGAVNFTSISQKPSL
jgi:hypothetical protein